MFRIYKYPLKGSYNRIKMPMGSKFLSAINQNEDIVVYALVDTSEESTLRDVMVVGTGNILSEEMLEDFKFLDTVVTHDGNLVWHIWYR